MSVNKNANQANTSRRSFLLGSSALTADRLDRSGYRYICNLGLIGLMPMGILRWE